MAHLHLQAAALEDAVDGLLDLFVVVCDARGELVANLPADAFGCMAATRHGLVALQNEGIVEQAPGCYRLSLYHAPEVPVSLLKLSVDQRVRANPAGLAAVYETVAEGHEIVQLQRQNSRA